MKPFKFFNSTMIDLDDVKRSLLSETVNGCLYMIYSTFPFADEDSINNTLSRYTANIEQLTDSFERNAEEDEEKQMVQKLKNYLDKLSTATISGEDALAQRDTLADEIADSVQGIAGDVEGTSYSRGFMQRYIPRVKAEYYRVRVKATEKKKDL